MKTDHIIDRKENTEFVESSDRQVDDGLMTFEAAYFARCGKLKYIEREEAKRAEEKARVTLRPMYYKYIEQMKKEGVSDELAVKAFIGRPAGN